MLGHHNNNNILFPVSESRMFISNTEARHQGLYQCFAENTAGIAHSEIRVNVDVTKRDTSKLMDFGVVKISQIDGVFCNEKCTC